MPSLTEERGELETAKCNLQAQTLVREGYTETRQVPVVEHHVTDSYGKDRTVETTEPRDTEVPPEHAPDEAIVEQGRHSMERLFGTTQWLSLRYEAGLALDQADIERQLEVWLNDFESPESPPEIDQERIEDFRLLRTLTTSQETRDRLAKLLGLSNFEVWSEKHPKLSKFPFIRLFVR
ncbi:hypothetical protein KKC44_02530 [Patescibacteria group bacterium]|nr:hypothetical protein [Patescibacteria group bacterium]MBU2259461.1 hypothetical protein [Patescibacteria group bacterium]